MIKAMIAWGSALLALTLVALGALDGPAAAQPYAAATPIVASTGATVSPIPTTPSIYWIAAPCATGSFGQLTVDHRPHAFLPVSVTLCSAYKSKFSFAVVAFRPDRSFELATPGNLRPYAENSPAGVVADLDLRPGYPLPTVGVCVMRSPTDRLACVRIGTTDDGVTTATPIGVDDPLVDRPVDYNGDLMPAPPDPDCGTCLSLHT